MCCTARGLEGKTEQFSQSSANRTWGGNDRRQRGSGCGDQMDSTDPYLRGVGVQRLRRAKRRAPLSPMLWGLGEEKTGTP